jgi:hypothetical protein
MIASIEESAGLARQRASTDVTLRDSITYHQQSDLTGPFWSQAECCSIMQMVGLLGQKVASDNLLSYEMSQPMLNFRPIFSEIRDAYHTSGSPLSITPKVATRVTTSSSVDTM